MPDRPRPVTSRSAAPGQSTRVGVVLITHRARHHLRHCLPPLLDSPLRPRVLVVNSSSGDGTLAEARRLGAETWRIPRAHFNHGFTREQARRRLATEVVVMMTPDAYPQGPHFLEKLTAPVRWGIAAVSYARQLPRPDADPIERLGRLFSYPDRSEIRSAEDWPRLGSRTHFCSNACAAWSNAALEEIGGFRPTLVSEETIATVELLRRGHRIAYVAEAMVIHSHPTRIWADFRRQFDIGMTRRLFRDLLLEVEGDERHGLAFLRFLLARLARESPALLPRALLHTMARYAGYRCGMLGPHLPEFLRRMLSSQDFFWLQSGPERAASGLPA